MIMMLPLSLYYDLTDPNDHDVHDDQGNHTDMYNTRKMFCHLVPLPEYSLVKKVGCVARYQLRSIHYQHDDDDDDCVGDDDNDDGGDD